MTNNIEKRPDDCFYKGLWDLYVKLKSLKEPYIKTKGYLFHIEDIDFTIGEKDYYFDGIASIDIPYHKETLTVSLLYYLDIKNNFITCVFLVNESVE